MQKRCVRPWLGDLRPNDAPRRIFGVESLAKTYWKKTGMLYRSVSKASTTRPETGALHPRDESRGLRSQVSVAPSACVARISREAVRALAQDRRDYSQPSPK